jgi:hypothetical protein
MQILLNVLDVADQWLRIFQTIKSALADAADELQYYYPIVSFITTETRFAA